MKKATCVKVHSADDLLHAEADSNMLRAWLHVIALGKKVQPKTHASQQIDYKSALKDSHKLYFSDGMAGKHPNLIGSYHSYASDSSSAWETASTIPDKGKALDVVRAHTMEDFRKWLISARRFSSWAGVGVHGVTVQRDGISRYGRAKVIAT